MRRLLALACALLLACSLCHAQTASNLIQMTAQDLTRRTGEIVDPTARARLDDALVSSLRALGPVQDIVGTADDVARTDWRASGRAIHAGGISDWIIVYSSKRKKVIRVTLTVTPIGQPIPAPPEGAYRGLAQANNPNAHHKTTPLDTSSAPPAKLHPCTPHPKLCQPAISAAPDPRLVEFLFATTRMPMKVGGRDSFSGERANGTTYGAARVRVPDDHVAGRIELPKNVGFLGVAIYEQKLDAHKHFVIKEVRKMSEQAWHDVLRSGRTDEALVFVHGYNNSFDNALYRTAQIVWDLQYRGKAVLFTWASRDKTVDYVYDQQSALGASARFADLIKKLSASGIKRVHVLAHSMGNYLVLNAFDRRGATSDPLHVAELILAAPDVDRDTYAQFAPAARAQSSGMTMYASSTDKALMASRRLAGNIPRAGDVSPAGPFVVAGVDTIDVSALGDEFLGLNHDTFAARRDVINDIHLLLSTSPRRGPSDRLAASVTGMPTGAAVPAYWRFNP